MAGDIQTTIGKVKSGIEAGKPVEEIFQSISEFIGKDPDTDGEMVASLVLIPDVRTGEILQRILRASKEKKTQKAIKRALYRLKSKGVAIEEASLEKGRSVLRPLEVETSKGVGSGIDPHGDRLLLLAVPHIGRGWTVMQGVTSDAQGFLDFTGSELTRKGMRELIQEMRKNTPFPFVDMEPSYVGFLFAEAYQLGLKNEKAPPQDYLRLKREVEAIKKDYEKPLVYNLIKSEEIAGDDWRSGKGGELLNAEVISTWILEEALVRPYVDAVLEAEESKIILSGTQKGARYQAIYEKALWELFSGERRWLYKRRLEEMAYVFKRLEKEEEAKTSLAVAIDLEKPLNPIRPNPFLFQLVVKSIAPFLKEARE